MTTSLEEFRIWIQRESRAASYFSGTFWFLFSNLSEPDFIKSLGLGKSLTAEVPYSDGSVISFVPRRGGKMLDATFSHLPVRKDNVHILFSLDKPSRALRPMYRLLARTRGKIQLFPMGYPLIRTCVKAISRFSSEEPYVVRGVSYPSRPNEGGADINLRPGSASVFFSRLEEERRVLKTARLRVKTSEESFCEFTMGRAGYLTYHQGDFRPLLSLITEELTGALTDSVRPFEKAKGHFVEFRFPDPLFADRANYGAVVDALSRLPRTSVALLHTNPYFHATMTNYEDGSEFDIFITGHSSIHVQGRADASPASFLRIQDGLAESFRDAKVDLGKSREFSLRDLIEGKV